MIRFLLIRFGLAVLFLVVETIFFVALHSYFSRPVDRMKNWFGRHSRRMVALMFPLLFVMNFGITFLFSTASTPIRPVSPQPARETSEPERVYIPVPTTPPSAEGADEPPPIPGTAADDTLQNTQENQTE
jgi:hypothetical protein